MEVESSSSCSSVTNWIVAHGSLQSCVTFESSISPIEENPDSYPKGHLVLKPPSSDSGPCEIKISFSQRYEVRQIYVRSTARIYEIYHALEMQSSNEYLCTVRCSIAAKEKVPICESAIGEAMAAQEKDPTEKIMGEKVRNDHNNCTNEDDWVEVKVPDSAAVENGTVSLPKTNYGNVTDIQDFYEATAEITDVSPCMSLTLRLLSLQTKGCVDIEEIYIFADPVLSAEADNQVGPVENSSGSSLMTMLIPTLMQLSNSRISKIHDKDISNVRQEPRSQDSSKIGSKNLMSRTLQLEGESSIADQKEVMTHEKVVTTTESASGMTDGQGIKMKEAIRDTAEFIHPGTGPQVSVAGNNSDSVTKDNYLFHNHLAVVLDQLVCRVGRIEAFCSRFEESMLKPLNSIESRLHRLEQQVEVLTVRSQPSELFSCTRFAAPEFSGNESGSNSFYNDGNGGSYSMGLELAGRDIPPDKSFFPLDDVSVSVDSLPLLLPHLVVTAPEFPGGDEDENEDDDDQICGDASEPIKQDCLTVEPKPSLSIDDALASALAGFLLSTPSHSSKHSQVTSVQAPDFTDEHDVDENLASSKVPCETNANPSTCDTEAVEPEIGNDSGRTPYNNSCQDGEVQMKQKNEHTEPFIKRTEGNCQDVYQTTALCRDNTERTDDCVTEEEIDNEETDTVICTADPLQEHTENSSASLLDGSVKLNYSSINLTGEHSKDTCSEGQPFIEQDDDRSLDATQEGASPRTVCDTAEGVPDADCIKNLSEDILKQTFNSVVDFELPLLDVKFMPKESLSARFSLEALLCDIPETKIQASSCLDDGTDGLVNGQHNPQLWMEEKEFDSTVDDLLVEVDDLIVEDMAPNVEVEKVEYSTCSNQEPGPSLI